MSKLTTVEYQLNFGIAPKIVFIYETHITKAKKELKEKADEYIFFLAVCLQLRVGESFKNPALFVEDFQLLGKFKQCLRIWYGRDLHTKKDRLVLKRIFQPKDKTERRYLKPVSRRKSLDGMNRPLKKFAKKNFVAQKH